MNEIKITKSLFTRELLLYIPVGENEKALRHCNCNMKIVLTNLGSGFRTIVKKINFRKSRKNYTLFSGQCR